MTVQVGQTYRDTDRRNEGRTLKVVEVTNDGQSAYLETVTNPNDIQQLLDDATPGTRSYVPKDRRGKRTRVAVYRLEQGKDYALMAEPPNVIGPA